MGERQRRPPGHRPPRLSLPGNPTRVRLPDGLEAIEVGHGTHVLTPPGVSAADLELRLGRVLGERHVAWVLETYAVDLVVDVGANVGQFASRLREHGYAGHVASVEPVPAYAAAAAERAAGDDRWSVHPVALGETGGELSLAVADVFSSARPASDFGRDRFAQLADSDHAERVTVPQRRLDTVWDDLLAGVRAAGTARPRVYLKLDTQGYDLQAFAGLGDRVGEVVAMQSETSLLPIYAGAPRLPEALAVYEGAGFAVTGLFPISKAADGRVIEHDCVLVRPDAFPGAAATSV